MSEKAIARDPHAARAWRELVAAAARQWEGTSDPAPDAEAGFCLAIARRLSPGLSSAAWDWIARQGAAAEQDWRSAGEFPLALEVIRAAEAWLARAAADADPLAAFYEQFLHAHHPHGRKRRGVFYTPLPIVRYLVRAVDCSLREEFGLAKGLLAERLPGGWPLRIVDPALGAGLFLTEIVRHAWQAGGDSAVWRTVAPKLLARLGGIEILPAAAALAVVRLAIALEETGYDFAAGALCDLKIGDALAAPLRPAWPIVVGNPPFSGISDAHHPWLARLLRGQGPDGAPRASYFEVEGRPLAERKHWLQDDYVKFLRVAHEQIETTGQGIVALVTNHGYLDNVTFRGLREKLWDTFPRAALIDLHGNAKRRERTPDGGRDENVFGIEQGVALGVWRRPPGDLTPRVERCDLWGAREEKFAALASADSLPWREVPRRAAGEAFHVAATPTFPEYDAGWSLAEAMPINTTAPVTARDAFVVALTRDELLTRLRDFADAALSDDEVRARYFTRTRSRKYAPGDTRGWRLADARAKMRAVDPETLVRRVLYRPFDWRWIAWAPWLIDWPRTEVMRHLERPGNLALITRRQAPPGQAWTFVWLTETLTLDGVIRSDNRGSESLFPLWLDGGAANFAPAFLDAFGRASGGASPGGSSPGEKAAEQVFYYLYALLHSSTYRQRYHGLLCGGFPRVPLPRGAELWARLCPLGARLATIHLGHVTSDATLAPSPYRGALPAHIAPGAPRWSDDRLWLNATDHFVGVPREAFQQSIGSHQLCRKWWRDRRGRPVNAATVAEFGGILSRLDQARRITADIDAALAARPWEEWFVA